LLLDYLLGAQVVFSGDRTREVVAEDAAKEQRAAGRRPYLIPLGASNEIGAVGFVAAIEELDNQLKEQRLNVDHVVFASSSFGTQAGLCVGAKAIGFTAQIAAIAIDSSRAELQAGVADLADATIRRLGLKLTFSPEEVVAYDGYLGAGYAVMGEPEKEAISLVARTEGILLDPVYTGRAMAGLIDLIRKGEFGKEETIVFWHTGGSAALFAYADQLLEGETR
jgi:D-cysteine desulfhydrase